MKHFNLFIVISFMALNASLAAQDLSEHRWKDRILLVYTTDRDSEMFRKQLDAWTNDMEGLEERKLELYAVTPSMVRRGWSRGEWEKRDDSLDKFLSKKGDFEVILLGLDGSVKLRQDQLLDSEKLYRTIDAMPMRQSELRNKK